MNRLYILRHGEASWSAATDRDRELTDNGVKQVTVVAEWLKVQNIQPEIFVSPYLRAKQTADIILDQNPTWQAKMLDLLMPSGDIHVLVEFLSQRSASDVLLVTHQPLVSHLSGYLLDNNPRSGAVSFSTACLAVLQSDGLPGCAQLETFISPEVLC